MKLLNLASNLSLTPDAARRVFAFLAMRGAGKTWAAAVLAEEMLKAGVPIIVLDPMGVWWGLQVGFDGKGKGLPVVVFGGEHANLPLEPDKAEKMADALIQSNVSCVIDISDLSHAAVQRFVPAFLDELRRKNTNDRHVLIEEADVIAPQKPQRNETVCLGAVDNFVRRGGNRNLGCSLISQRSAVVNKNVLTQSDFLVVLRTNAPQDKKAVSEWAVRRTDDKKALNTWLDSLSDLEDGEAYVWGPDMNVPGLRTRFRIRETFHATRENLKRFDPSKIRPMPVSEFVERFRDVFEGRRRKKPDLSKGIGTLNIEPDTTGIRIDGKNVRPTEGRIDFKAVPTDDGEGTADISHLVKPTLDSIMVADRLQSDERGASRQEQPTMAAPPSDIRARSSEQPGRGTEQGPENPQTRVRIPPRPPMPETKQLAAFTLQITRLESDSAGAKVAYILRKNGGGVMSARAIEAQGVEYGWTLDRKSISQYAKGTLGAVVPDPNGNGWRLAKEVEVEEVAA
jgi:Helicase HerA, central domain